MKKLFSRFSLTMSLVLFVFLMMLCSTVIVALIILLLFKTGMLQYFPRFPEKYRLFGPILLLLFISILTGTMLTGISKNEQHVHTKWRLKHLIGWHLVILQSN